jgi:hypothetical protein
MRASLERLLTVSAFFLVAGCSETIAATIDVQVFCGGDSISRQLVVDAPFSVGAMCPDGLSSASGSGSNPVSVSVATNGNGNAAYSSLVEVTFTGGTGAGFYVPCLNINYAQSGGSGAAFGPVDLGSKFPAGGTCFSPLSLDSRIPFTFDVPQRQLLSLDAGSISPGQASARISGFLVYDASGNQITGATLNAVNVAVPEPSFAIPILLAFAVAAVKRRRKHAIRAESRSPMAEG